MTDTTNTENADVTNPNHAAPVVPASSVPPFPGVKIDEASLEAFAQKIAATLSTDQAQSTESQVLGGLPAKARGLIYSVGGGVAATGAALVSWDAANPGVLPQWLTAVAGIASPILAALTGGVAWANLSKK